MKTLAKRVLDLILRAFAPMLLLRAELSTESVPRPADQPRGQAPGPDPDRILLLGSGPAMGYGVLSHELALPGHLARQISALTGRGVTVDVVADSDIDMTNAIERLAPLSLERYDALVLTIGVNDALGNTPLKAWRRSLTSVLEHVSMHLPSDGHTFVIAIPPIMSIPAFNNITGLFPELHADSLNHESARICEKLLGVTFIPFAPKAELNERHRNSASYSRWASLIVPTIIGSLQQGSRFEPDPSNDESRQNAVEALQILDTEPEERFDRIAEFAKRLFGTESCVISFLDHDREWMKTRVGFEPDEAPRGSLLIEQVVKQSDTFVVENASEDERFTDSLFVIGQPFLRFYAGHPILSIDGERVGVISIFDSQPRQFSTADSRFLRDLAHLVERELRISQK